MPPCLLPPFEKFGNFFWRDMTSDELYIGIDSGTQGTKAIVFSREQKKVIAADYAGYELIELPNGGREQDPLIWINACEKVLKKVLSYSDVKPFEIKAVSVSGQQHGFVALDETGNVIRPAKLWCDTETQPQCDDLTSALGGRNSVIKHIGNSFAAGFTASKILWLKEKEPENYKKLKTVLLPHDYINFWLTGEKKAEFGDASGTAFFDVKTRTWSEKVINAIDQTGKLWECLPQLIAADEPVGNIRTEIAEKLGLPQNVVVASGGGDNMIAAIGTGNVESGVVTASLGTSGTIYAYADQPVIDPNGEVAAFCSSTGGWLPLVCTMNVTVATELIRNLFNLSLEEFNQLAEKSPPGANGIMLLPYFNGERTPALPHAKGSFHGLTALNTQPENFCRAAMEGATLGLKYALEALKNCGISPTEIRLTGGGAKSPLWRQVVADIFGYSVVPTLDDESGALGAAIHAMWCYDNKNNGNVRIKELTDEYIRMDEKNRIVPDSNSSNNYADFYQQFLRLNSIMDTVCNNKRWWM